MMTNSKLNYWKKYCSEPLELVENYQQALADDFEGWCIHHRREIQPDGTRVSAQELKDQGLYFGRPAEELVFMRREDHTSLHSTGNKFFLGYHHSAETRKKQSEANSGENHPFFGKHLPADTRRKIAEANKGKHPSEETRKKLSESKKGKNNPFFGKHRSEDTRQKLSKSLKGKHKSAEHRKKNSLAHRGMHWWNNGVSCKYSRECPGEGWTRGRLRFKV